jgi:hypothetical protein
MRHAVLALAALGLLAQACNRSEPEPPTAAQEVASDFIEGRVASGDGQPEAGVWVIAETASLPTPYRKIVVTDDQGRFAIPELPAADYQVWVRG